MPQEEGMSFSPAFASDLSLSSPEGSLVSISIRVAPRSLESLLEALAKVEFPINPQIYHEAEIVFLHSDGREAPALTTLVEFPAYLRRLEEVYRALESEGFDRESVVVTSMLDQLRSSGITEPSGSRPGWVVRSRRKASFPPQVEP
jgi:hypothetical protein